MSDPTDFGTLLRRLRTERQLSQSQLAERANTSVEAISALERGFRKRPHPSTLDLLGTALALDRDQMKELRESSRAVPRAIAKSTAATSPGDEVPNNLPIHLTSFVGREKEIVEITAAVGRHRFVTLVGPGGIGKTRSSLRVAAAVCLERPSDGVWFVELAPLTSGDLVPATIASAMRLNLASSEDPVANLVRALSKRTCLIVLDNCEHVITAAASIGAALIASCPGVRVLASSREPLGIAGEVVYRLPALSVPVRASTGAQTLTAAVALASPAVALFADRAHAADSRFAVTDENAATVARICERLDGIPLAIELAAPRSSIFTPKQLLERLDDRFRVLADGRRDALPRQQTLRALIDWSYDLLSDPERKMFRALGIFARSFTLEGAVAVAGAGLDEFEAVNILAALTDKSLVTVDDAGEAKRFRLLETTHAYARERLEETGQLETIARRHLEYLRDLFRDSVARRERTGNGASHESLFAIELDDVRVAADFALSRESVETGAELLAAINGISWTHIGHGSEGLARLQAFRDALGDRQPVLVARLCAWIAVLARELGRRQLAGEASEMAVACARAADDSLVLATALARHANTMVSLERFEEARVALEEAERFPTPSPMQGRRISEARANLARTSGDLDTAAAAWEKLREHLRSLGDSGDERVATVCLSECEFQRGNIARAIALIEEVLPGASAAADWGLHARALCDLAAYCVAGGVFGRSRQYAEDATRLAADRDRTSPHLLTGLEILALLYARSGDAARATRIVAFTAAAARNGGIRREYVATWIYEQLRREVDAAELNLENGRFHVAADAVVSAVLDAGL